MSKAGSRLKTIYIAFIMLIMYLPMLVVVIYSFNESKTSAVWKGFTLDWYIQMFNDRELMRSFWVSFLIAAVSGIIAVVLGGMGALALKNVNHRLKELVNGITYLPIIIPEVILGIALLVFFGTIDLGYGIGALIIAHSTFCIPYVFILVQIRMMLIDDQIYEAAMDLGATSKQILFTVTIPLLRPAFILGWVLAFAMSMDDVIISVFLSGPKSATLPVKVYSMMKVGVTPKINALYTIILAVVVLISYIIWRGYFKAEKKI